MIKVEYGYTASGVKEGLTPTLLNFAEISSADDLTKDELIFKNYVNPCEQYSAILDGRALPIPEDLEDENIGVWSLYKSNANGEFGETLPTITLTGDELYTVDGLTLNFDTFNNVYPTLFSVSFFNGETLIAEEECEPNSANFLLIKDVEEFDKIVMVFEKMNTPYSRLKLHSIQYGTIFFIDESSIRNLKIHQVVNTLSTTIPSSKLNLSFLNADNTNYNFAARQSLKIYNNDVLIGKYFIENAKQTNLQEWKISAEDYINILESTPFEGGIYEKELASNVITAIFNNANVPFTITSDLDEAIVTGYIPYTTCRKALQQVLFAVGGYVDTSYSESVNILVTSDEVQQSITFEQIMMGQSISVDADITEIELVGHIYTPIDDETTLYTTDNAEDGTKVIFDEPIHSLEIIGGEIIKGGSNYAIIKCVAGAELKGKKYEHTIFSKSRKNENAKNTKISNKKIIKSATLVSADNIDRILQVCYNNIVKNSMVKAKVIETNIPFVVGRTYEIETQLLGNVKGILSEQKFSLYGGKKIIKDMVIK